MNTSTYSSGPSKPSSSIFDIGSSSSAPSVTPPASSSTTGLSSELFSDNSSGGFFSDFSWTTIILFILILALLGVNIFLYLAKGTEGITDLLGPTFKEILTTAGLVTGEVTKDITEVSAEGAKTGIDVVKNTVVNTVDRLEGKDSSNIKGNTYDASTNNNETPNQEQDTNGYYESIKCKNGCPEPSANESDMTDKLGWCYIGEENGQRSCIEVNQNDTCMSGDIFPSKNVCINPNLRT